MPTPLSPTPATAQKKSITLILLGVTYLILGILTALQLVAAWHFNQVLLWPLVGYGLLNFLIALGFFSREHWVVWALSANFCGTTILLLLKHLTPPLTLSSLVPVLIAPLINIVFLSMAYTLRKRMRDTSKGRWVGYVFGALWLALFCYTIYINI